MKALELDAANKTYKLPFETHSKLSFRFFVLLFISIISLIALSVYYFHNMLRHGNQLASIEAFDLIIFLVLLFADLILIYFFFFYLFGFGKIRIDSSGVYVRMPFTKFFETWNNISYVENRVVDGGYRSIKTKALYVNTVFNKRVNIPLEFFTTVNQYTLEKTIVKHMYHEDTTYYKLSESDNNAD